MKKTIMFLAATIAATAAMAQTNQVLSRNAVGYVRIDVPAGKFGLLSNPFVQVGTGVESASVQSIFGDVGSPLPGGFQVLMWNQQSQTYRGETFDDIDGWTPGTNLISRGEGVFVKVPAVYTGATYSIYFIGEVPTAIKTNKIAASGAFSAVGYAFPTSQYLTNTTLNALATQGDQVLVWNLGTQSYNGNSFDEIDGWTSPSQVILPGQGMFFRHQGSVANWVEAKPYTWP